MMMCAMLACVVLCCTVLACAVLRSAGMCRAVLALCYADAAYLCPAVLCCSEDIPALLAYPRERLRSLVPSLQDLLDLDSKPRSISVDPQAARSRGGQAGAGAGPPPARPPRTTSAPPLRPGTGAAQPASSSRTSAPSPPASSLPSVGHSMAMAPPPAKADRAGGVADRAGDVVAMGNPSHVHALRVNAPAPAPAAAPPQSSAPAQQGGGTSEVAQPQRQAWSGAGAGPGSWSGAGPRPAARPAKVLVLPPGSTSSPRVHQPTTFPGSTPRERAAAAVAAAAAATTARLRLLEAAGASQDGAGRSRALTAPAATASVGAGPPGPRSSADPPPSYAPPRGPQAMTVATATPGVAVTKFPAKPICAGGATATAVAVTKFPAKAYFAGGAAATAATAPAVPQASTHMAGPVPKRPRLGMNEQVAGKQDEKRGRDSDRRGQAGVEAGTGVVGEAGERLQSGDNENRSLSTSLTECAACAWLQPAPARPLVVERPQGEVKGHPGMYPGSPTAAGQTATRGLEASGRATAARGTGSAGRCSHDGGHGLGCQLQQRPPSYASTQALPLPSIFIKTKEQQKRHLQKREPHSTVGPTTVATAAAAATAGIRAVGPARQPATGEPGGGQGRGQADSEQGGSSAGLTKGGGGARLRDGDGGPRSRGEGRKEGGMGGGAGQVGETESARREKMRRPSDSRHAGEASRSPRPPSPHKERALGGPGERGRDRQRSRSPRLPSPHKERTLGGPGVRGRDRQRRRSPRLPSPHKERTLGGPGVRGRDRQRSRSPRLPSPFKEWALGKGERGHDRSSHHRSSSRGREGAYDIWSPARGRDREQARHVGGNR